MSWGVALRNALGLGLGGIPSLRKSGAYPKISFDFTKGTLDPLITFTRASTATYFDSAGVLQSAAIDAPRFDYNPSTLAALGLLIEEARTNRLLQSAAFDNASWALTNATVTANTVNSPDGTQNADLLLLSSGTSTKQIEQSVTTTATAYAFSVFVKANGHQFIQLRSGAGISGGYVNFDVINGVVGTQSTWTGSVTSLNNGWFRIIALTGTVSAATAAFVIQAVGSNTATRNETVTASGTTGVYLYGAQLEAGAFSTSYIPTSTTVLTRSADIATMTGTNFTSWFRQMLGTFYVEYQGVNNVGGATRRAFEVGVSGSTNDRYLVGYQATTTSRFFIVQNNATQADVNVTGVTQSNIVKTAAAYSTNDARMASNGTLGTADTSVTTPTVSQLWFGAAENATANTVINGYIRKFAYYPENLRDGTLQALTT